MAPTMGQTTDTILHIFNDDFFKHKHCPMRTGNLRCRKKSTCDRVDFGSQAGPQNAVKLRDQLMRQIDLVALEEPSTESPVWSGIEAKVEMLVDWVLCKKHLMQRDTAIRMTMSFLKQDCGIFVQEQQSTTSHKQYPASDYVSSTSIPSIASYHSAATHLVTPPMSPTTATQNYVHQQPFVFRAGESLKTTSISGNRLEKLQQAPFVFPVGDHVRPDPVKIEPDSDDQAAPPQVIRNGSYEIKSGSAKSDGDTKPMKSQPVPFGFGVLNAPSKKNVTKPPSTQHPSKKPIRSEQPSASSQEQNGIAATSQSSEARVPFGFQVRPRSEHMGSILSSTTPKTPSTEPLRHEKRYEQARKAPHDTPNETSRSQIDEMVDNLEALQLSNKKLEKEKQRFEAKWRRAEDRVGELEDENEALKSEVDGLKCKVGQLQKEMAALWKVVGARE